MASVHFSSLSPPSEGDRVSVTLPPQKLKATAKQYINEALYWLKAVAVVLFFITAVFSVIGASMYYHQKKVAGASIRCFECISITGATLDEPGLPVEKECLNHPKNVRQCNAGEICAVVKIQTDRIVRVQRSCTDQKIVGCNHKTKPANSSFCYCNFNLCRS